MRVRAATASPLLPDIDEVEEGPEEELSEDERITTANERSATVVVAEDIFSIPPVSLSEIRLSLHEITVITFTAVTFFVVTYFIFSTAHMNGAFNDG